MRTRAICRRLNGADADLFQALRLEGFTLEPRAFRFAPEDEVHVPSESVAARLQRDFVIGAFNEEDSQLIGVGGLAWSDGVKTRHKALLYGMYVKAAERGSGVADAIMKRLIDEARGSVEIVTLTVVSTNFRALRFYERWGFRAYGVEERSAKNDDGDYLDETLMALRFVDENRRQDESR
ncbi:GNAT family N-acetyltransferase [Methylocystis sp. H4A]|nr:GNAT family N-acetyltransferase [Methylocystis sp. H4A]MBG0802047.1 GNAT family N-acetyltransferase [Methylocystis sp. H4A]